MKTSVADAIRQRRTIHQFIPGSAPSREILLAAIQHAVWAPNHHLSEPWRFYLPGPRTIEDICQLNAAIVRETKGEQAAEVKLRRWREIPGWLLMTCIQSEEEVRRWEDYAACCCAAQNLMLYLWDQGIGVKWTTGAISRDPRFFARTGIDAAREKLVGIFWCGSPADVPMTARQPVDGLLTLLP